MMQTPTMKTPPNVISGKDLNYLKDMLSWNLAAAKQAKHYVNEATDPEVKGQLEAVYQMHKKHYDAVLLILQNSNNQ
jgi:hypothetical protein